MRIRPMRWDGPIISLCYVCAFLLCASPLIPYEFDPTQLGIFTAVIGTPLAVLGVWLNHKAENSPKKD